MVKTACPKCAKNQDAFEVIAVRLWEARLEIQMLRDYIADMEAKRDNA